MITNRMALSLEWNKKKKDRDYNKIKSWQIEISEQKVEAKIVLDKRMQEKRQTKSGVSQKMINEKSKRLEEKAKIRREKRK